MIVEKLQFLKNRILGQSANPNINKVFGIGSQKTGTTTLGACLKHLEFRPHAGFKQSKRQIKFYTAQPEVVLSFAANYRSFQDAPWSFGDFYKKLDEHFPGSKFILTEREPDKWIGSFLRWKMVGPEKKTDIRHRFGDDKLAALVHKVAWNIDYEKLGDNPLEPHQTHYKTIYENRNQQIREYFNNRPQDLLIVDWEKGHGWEELCGFLGVKVPSTPFPHKKKNK